MASTRQIMSKKILIAIIVVLVILGIGLYWFLQKQPEKYPGPVEKVTMGISFTSLSPSLIHIAEEKGYFLKEGIDLEIKGYSAGKFALSAALKGEVDIATVAGLPIVLNSFERGDFTIFVTIFDSTENLKALARKDRNINAPQDLIGKKMATTIGTTGHFFMATFFILNGLDFSDVEIVDLKPEEMVEAIVNGDVDAIFAWEPNILNSQRMLKDKAIILPSIVGYMETFNLVSKKDFIENNPELIKKILKALVKAEEFIKDNREESIDIIVSRLKADEEFIDKLWDGNGFQLSLSQSLLVIMEDMARWTIKNNLTDKTEVPNYLDYIYMDALGEVKPEAIGIIR